MKSDRPFRVSPPPTYVWHRQIKTPVRLLHIQAGREFLAPETALASEYVRCQFSLYDLDVFNQSFRGVWNGKDVTFDVNIRPLAIDFGAKVYGCAIRDILAQLPNCTRHHFESGPLIGERRLVYPDHLDQAVTPLLIRRFNEIVESEAVTVCEQMEVIPSKDGKRVSVNFAENRHEDGMHMGEAFPLIFDEIRESVQRGNRFAVKAAPQSLKEDHEFYLEELPLPELVALNWKTAKPPCGPAEREIYAAVERLDLQGIVSALAKGADPNAVSEGGETPMTRLVGILNCSKRDTVQTTLARNEQEQMILAGIDVLVDAGASVNWASLETFTPLAMACQADSIAIVSRLLELGSDPSIRCGQCDNLNNFGTAWEIAAERNPEIWNLMLNYWPNPFGVV